MDFYQLTEAAACMCSAGGSVPPHFNVTSPLGLPALFLPLPVKVGSQPVDSLEWLEFCEPDMHFHLNFTQVKMCLGGAILVETGTV